MQVSCSEDLLKNKSLKKTRETRIPLVICYYRGAPNLSNIAEKTLVNSKDK